MRNYLLTFAQIALTALVGGTLYFALMGVVMVIAAVLIFRHRRGGILLYKITLFHLVRNEVAGVVKEIS
ncbi:hypothetical protein [Klebsiella quasipneumoniae]|uniref:hypothetical protein n=1 Tax=Klebsiella quasipneumoniae TaxID=1463165 RepID=UPI00220DBAB0|nr:hypothetical protein [Klebsiella quasipneumoniae]BDO02732.1 hypothetical protein KAM622c_23190 [Klebsiella quasipneumoniae subsp. quasipneumoniae]